MKSMLFGFALLLSSTICMAAGVTDQCTGINDTYAELNGSTGTYHTVIYKWSAVDQHFSIRTPIEVPLILVFEDDEIAKYAAKSRASYGVVAYKKKEYVPHLGGEYYSASLFDGGFHEFAACARN